MKKLFKILFSIFIAIILSFNFITYYPKASNDLELVQDSTNITKISKKFRKSTDVLNLDEGEKFNLTGLKDLNISGSAQFSKEGLSLIKKSIGDKYNITVVDLREESHGFINGIPISFKNNNANEGLSLNEILNDEDERLNSIKLNEPITFSNTNISVIPKEVYSEETLTKDNNLNYITIPVTDGGLPSANMVNRFKETVINNKGNNNWFHFHCKAGIGRTTTFMIMYDIVKNCNEVSLEDIITRQVKLFEMSENDSKGFYSGDRYKFLSDFYNECKGNLKNTFNKNNNKNDYYIKNNIIPKTLYVIKDNEMTKEE